MKSLSHSAKKDAASDQEAALTNDLLYGCKTSITSAGVNTITSQSQVSIVPLESTPADFTISMVAHLRHPETKHCSARSVLEEICSGRWAAQIASIREVFNREGKEAARPLKDALPAVIFSGTFLHRSDDGLVAHSGLICADLDALGDSIPHLRQKIQADPHTLSCFLSPSGNGLKVVMRCDPQRAHKESFRALERYFLENFGVPIDHACSNVSRLCFVSHDPEAYIAQDAKEIPYPPAPEPFKAPDEGRLGSRLTNVSRPGDDFNERGNWATLLEKHGWTVVRENLWRRPGKSDGTSAIWNPNSGTFWNWSSNASPLEANRLYRPWHLYALLEHNGDFSAAARTLASQGYGSGTVQAPAKSNGIRSLLDSRRYDPTRKPAPPKPLLKLQGVTICTPGNLTTISGQAKVGKSSVVQAILASYMEAARPTRTSDNLGFKATYTRGERIVHFDTEQSAYDSHRLIERALARFGGSFPPALLESYSLAGLPAQTLRDCLRLKVEELGASTGVSLVLIDGVADLIDDVNEQRDSNALVAHLQCLAMENNCAIICVLHENPTQEGGKMRGHLGSQLERKAESNLRLKRQGESITVYGERMRGAPIYEKDGVAFRWDPMKDMHVSVGSSSAVKLMQDRAKYQPEAEEVMKAIGQQPATWIAVVNAICQVRGIKRSTAEDRLNRMSGCEVLIKDPATGLWLLNPI